MKKNIIFFVFSFILLASCNNSEVEKENKRLLLLNTNLNKSLAEYDRWNNKKFLKDSLKIETEFGILGELRYSDTLVLHAEFADCGEFGGHREWLKIYFEKNKYKCKIIYDSVVCRYKNIGKKYFRITDSIISLNESDKNNILDYVFDLTRMKFQYQEMQVNASNYFSASIKSTHGFETFEKFEISSYDHSFNWNGFKKLRNRLKN